MQDPCCAHLTIRWTEQRMGRGETRGWWECELCRTKFVPMPVIKPPQIEESVGNPWAPNKDYPGKPIS